MGDDSEDLHLPLLLDIAPPSPTKDVFNCTGSNESSIEDERCPAMLVLTDRRLLMHMIAFQPPGIPVAHVVAREERVKQEFKRRKRYYLASVALCITEVLCMIFEAWIFTATIWTEGFRTASKICLLIVFGFNIITGIIGWVTFNRMGLRSMAMQRRVRGKNSGLCLLISWLLFVPTWISRQFLSEDTNSLLCFGYVCCSAPIQFILTLLSELLLLILFIVRVYLSPITNIFGIRKASMRHNFAGGYPDLEVDPQLGARFRNLLQRPYVDIVQINPIAGIVQYFARSELNLRDYRIVAGVLFHYIPLVLFGLALQRDYLADDVRWLGIDIGDIGAATSAVALICCVSCGIVAVLQKQLLPTTFLRRSMKSFWRR